MGEIKVYGFEMACISEVYLSTMSSLMAPFGLERYFFPLLLLCEHNGNLTQKDLAKAIRRDKVYTMRIVDYLCKRDFIIRKQDVNDRRCYLLEVTSKAKEILPKIKEAINKTDELLFHNFSPEEKENFKIGMDKVFATINTLPDPEFFVKAFKRNKK
jgi:DNA-binding MarR family transcriptional regulator